MTEQFYNGSKALEIRYCFDCMHETDDVEMRAAMCDPICHLWCNHSAVGKREVTTEHFRIPEWCPLQDYVKEGV